MVASEEDVRSRYDFDVKVVVTALDRVSATLSFAFIDAGAEVMEIKEFLGDCLGSRGWLLCRVDTMGFES